MRRACLLAFGCALGAAILGPVALAQVPAPEDKPIVGRIDNHIYNPVRLPATDERLAQLKLPDGFRIQKFAEGLGNPRMLAIAKDGTVYVTRREQGDLVMLRDTNNDGRADVRESVVRRPMLHGVAIDGSRMYLATVKDVFVVDIQADGKPGELRRIIDDLPDGGQHPNRTLRIGPDGMLYISIGSTCNACEETNPEHATLLRARPDGTSRTIFARGLRNTLGFDWHPQTRQLWGMDHGIDWLGNDSQREEFNLIEQDRNYGWPYVFEDNKVTPHRRPPHVDIDTWKRISVPSVLTYTAHASGMQMDFYRGRMFPEEYRNDAFVAMRGSWNANPPVGYEVVRIRYDAQGRPRSIEPFVTGFLVRAGDGFGQFARPTGLAVSPVDGSLFFTDDTQGVIFRVTYDPQRTAAK